MSVKEGTPVSPELYHAHHQSYQEDLPYWLSLAEGAGGGVLELGCGTGRVLLPLLEAGVDVVGLDSSVEMLAFLAKRLQDGGISGVQLVEADMASFNLNRQFDLIFLPCNTYSSLTADERRAALVCIRDHLRSGGRFAASIFNPERLVELEARSEAQLEAGFTHPSSGNPVQVSSAWQKVGKRWVLTWHYDHLLPDGRVQRSSRSTSHQIQDWPEYLLELEQAGFALEKVYGDFSGGEFDPDSDHAVFSVVPAG